VTIYEKILKNRQDIEKGIYKNIPFNIDRFCDYTTGVLRGDFSCITANSGVGKTQLTKFLYVFSAIEFAIENKLNLKIVYFALEESETQFDYSLISYLLRKEKKVRKSILDFESIKNPIDLQTLEHIKQLQELFNLYKSYIILVDDVYNTTGLYKKVRDLARERGNFYLDNVKLTNQQLITNQKWDLYKPNDPEEFIIIITDHVSELHKEQGEADLHESIQNWTRKQRHYICKRFNYHCVAVHQQMGAQESLENFKLNKLFPTKNGLADNKLAGRSYLNIYGITDLYQHDIQNYEGYPLNEYVRILNIIKQRYGISTKKIAIFFDGKTNYIKAMPDSRNIAEMKKFYNHIDEIKKSN
jgi:hypothetical protein